jgi:hypothetical protein
MSRPRWEASTLEESHSNSLLIAIWNIFIFGGPDREITFENAEELTEEGLPFLILFHNPDDTDSIKVSRLYWYRQPSRLCWYKQPSLLVQRAASIGSDSRLCWFRQPPLLVQTAAFIGSDSRLYLFGQPPLLVQTAATIGTDSCLYWCRQPPLYYRGVTVLLLGWVVSFICDLSMQISPLGC